MLLASAQGVSYIGQCCYSYEEVIEAAIKAAMVEKRSTENGRAMTNDDVNSIALGDNQQVH